MTQIVIKHGLSSSWKTPLSKRIKSVENRNRLAIYDHQNLMRYITNSNVSKMWNIISEGFPRRSNRSFYRVKRQSRPCFVCPLWHALFKWTIIVVAASDDDRFNRYDKLKCCQDWWTSPDLTAGWAVIDAFFVRCSHCLLCLIGRTTVRNRPTQFVANRLINPKEPNDGFGRCSLGAPLCDGLGRIVEATRHRSRPSRHHH